MLTDKRRQFRIAAENPRKYEVVIALQQEKRDRILIIGEYLDQLQQIAERTGLPVVTGKTQPDAITYMNNFARSHHRINLVTSRQFCPGSARCGCPDSSIG